MGKWCESCQTAIGDEWLTVHGVEELRVNTANCLAGSC